MSEPPGVPLPSGFRRATPEEAKRARLSPEAHARLQAVADDSRRARLAAAAAAVTAVIG